MDKKIYILLILAGLLSLGTVRAQWIPEKCPTQNNLNAIFFTGSNSGWIVGDKGTILYKLDNKWIAYQKPTNNNLNSVFMLNEKDGWAVGAKGTIIHFDGNNWENMECPTKKDLNSVSFSDPENGVAVGENGTIVIYENKGWRLVERKIPGNLYATTFSNDEIWMAGGLECVNFPIMKMQNTNRKVTNSFNLNASINSINLINPNNGWAVGSPSTLMHFDGQKWEKYEIDFSHPSLRSVFFSNENNGISVGYGGAVLIYYENKWTMENFSTTRNLNGAAINGNYYYAVGDSGTIIGKAIDTRDELKSNHLFNTLNIQIYPNPCDELINIVIPGENDSSTLFVSITNSAGQIIMQKELKSNSGNLPCEIMTKDFTNGLYILNITAGSKTNSSKFIIRH